MPAWRRKSSPVVRDGKVIVPASPGDVIIDDHQRKYGVVRNQGIKRWEAWKAMPTRVKVTNGIALAVITIVFSLALTFVDPIFVFALALCARLGFYGFARYYVEKRAYDAAVATRSFMAIQVFAYLAVIIDVFETQSTWRITTFLILVFMLTMEVVGVRTWYSRWMEREERQMRQMHPFTRALHPKVASLLVSFACLIVEYVVFLFMWSKLLDETILWMYHALIWMHAHPVESIILIVVALVIIVVSKVYLVIAWIFINPISIIGLMVIVGIFGTIIH